MTRYDDALMRSIRAAPDDDAPRLIYADWLDEHDQPERAEFVRVQCELSREYPDEVAGKRGDHLLRSAGGRYCLLRERERGLAEHHSKDWWPDVGVIAKRGFVVHLSCNFDVWLRIGDEIDKQETICEVQLLGANLIGLDAALFVYKWRHIKFTHVSVIGQHNQVGTIAGRRIAVGEFVRFDETGHVVPADAENAHGVALEQGEPASLLRVMLIR